MACPRLPLHGKKKLGPQSHSDGRHLSRWRVLSPSLRPFPLGLECQEVPEEKEAAVEAGAPEPKLGRKGTGVRTCAMSVQSIADGHNVGTPRPMLPQVAVTRRCAALAIDFPCSATEPNRASMSLVSRCTSKRNLLDSKPSPTPTRAALAPLALPRYAPCLPSWDCWMRRCPAELRSPRPAKCSCSTDPGDAVSGVSESLSRDCHTCRPQLPPLRTCCH